MDVLVEVAPDQSGTAAAGKTNRLKHADDAKDCVVDLDGRADRIAHAEELLGDFATDHAHRRARDEILVAQIAAARFEVQTRDIKQFRR